jgi:hypothetical protein
LKFHSREVCEAIVEDIKDHQDDFLPSQVDGFYINRMGHELVHPIRNNQHTKRHKKKRKETKRNNNKQKNTIIHKKTRKHTKKHKKTQKDTKRRKEW